MDFGMVLMGAMTEVEPERVDAGEEQRFQHFGRSTRRSDGGDDLGPAIATHGSIGLLAASGDQNRSDVVDVGAGRPGANEVAGSGKETLAVMRHEIGPRVKLARSSACARSASGGPACGGLCAGCARESGGPAMRRGEFCAERLFGVPSRAASTGCAARGRSIL